MKGIKIKQRQTKCFERWVLNAVYIPNEIRRMLIESVSNPIIKDEHVHMKFNDETIDYLSKECPIAFMQRKASEAKAKNNQLNRYNWIELKLDNPESIEHYSMACRVGCYIKFDNGEICLNDSDNLPFAIVTHYSLKFELN